MSGVRKVKKSKIEHSKNNNNHDGVDDDNNNNAIDLTVDDDGNGDATPAILMSSIVKRKKKKGQSNNDDDDATNSNDLINEGSESSLETRKTYRHVRVNHGLKFRSDDDETRCHCAPSKPDEAAIAPLDVAPPPSDAVRFLPRRSASTKVSASSLDCGANCVSRAMQHECDPSFCPCGKLCQNNVFRRRKYARVKTVRTPDKGIGLICTAPIKRGDFVIEYTGEVITEQECFKRMSASARDDDDDDDESKRRHFYYLNIESGVTIDAGASGNPSRFINHSCDPNCETQKWHSRGLPVMGLFAKRDIPAGTELTFDYRWEPIGDKQLVCRCGAKSCRGLLGGKRRATAAEERQRERQLAVKERETNKRNADNKHQQSLNTNYSSRVILSLGRLLLLAGTAGGSQLPTRQHAVAHDTLLRRALFGAFHLPMSANVADARAALDELVAEQRERAAGRRRRGPFLRRNVASRIASLTLVVDRIASGLSMVPLSRLRAPVPADALPLMNLLATKKQK
jgi:hypothetical protein